MPTTSAPPPSRIFYDPFSSSSTGHQRAENRLSGSQAWRNSRSHKLARQLRDSSGRGGRTFVPDLVSAGSEDFEKDGRKENGFWELGAPRCKEQGCQDIRSFWRPSKRQKRDEMTEEVAEDFKRAKHAEVDAHNPNARPNSPPQTSSTCPQPRGLQDAAPCKAASGTPSVPAIFRSLNLYINGSTLSAGISDHKLKSLFIQHGGSFSISLGRRTVTHVVLGTGCGGLAGIKIQREVAKVGGKGVKYVTADWVLDSVKAGKRLTECKYQAVHIALKGQQSVLSKLDSMGLRRTYKQDMTDGR